MNQDIKQIKFSEIESIPSSNKEIFHYGNPDVNLFLEYFSLRYNKYKERFIVESRFFWQMYQKQSKIRILLVQMDDEDVVYCYVKNVTIYPAIYLILMGVPVSQTGNTDNEQQVLRELCKYNHVKGFEGIQEEIDSLESKELFSINPPYYEEYYIDTQERFDNYLGKGHFRAKYSINKLKSDSEFIFRKFEPQDYEQNQALVDLWKSSKIVEKKGIQFETKSYTDILNSIYNNKLQDEYLIYNLFYKEKLIGCLMFLILNVSDVKISYQEHNLNLSRLFETNNELNLDIGFYKNIGNIMFYLTTEDLINRGIKFSYCQGVKFWKRQKSGEYKKRLNDRTIEFSKVFYKQ